MTKKGNGKDKVKPSDMIRVPADDVITKEIAKLDKLAKEQKSAAGVVGQRVNDLCENKHFDKKALAVIRGLHNMPDEKFRISWPHIVKYAEALGFDDRADEQPDLPDTVADGDKPTKADVEGKNGANVHTLKPGREVGEKAGA